MEKDESRKEGEFDELVESLKREKIKKACYNTDQLNEAASELGFPCTMVEGLTREEEKRIGEEPGFFGECLWVSVTDKLPEHDQEVITYSGDMMESMPEFYKMGITRYTKRDREYFYGGSLGGYQVTHWMPRISTPKEA